MPTATPVFHSQRDRLSPLFSQADPINSRLTVKTESPDTTILKNRMTSGVANAKSGRPVDSPVAESSNFRVLPRTSRSDSGRLGGARRARFVAETKIA